MISKKCFYGTGNEVVLEKPVWVGKLPEEDELIVDNLYYSHSPLCNALCNAELEYLFLIINAFLISNSITMSPTTNGNHYFVVMLTSHKIDKTAPWKQCRKHIRSLRPDKTRLLHFCFETILIASQS